MAEIVPSKWAALVVKYGEKEAFCYYDHDSPSPHFFATETEAQKWAEDHCRYDQKAMVLVLKADRLVKAKPVEFENIAA